MTARKALEARVIEIVAEALDVKPDEVRLHSSLIDDLQAESIDFLDILFRIESAFGIKIPEDELWKGSFDGTGPESIERGVMRLRERMPDFRWDRLPAQLTRDHLPRLITVRTIVDYLEHRGIDVPGTEA
jgi:acyl carrier protein